MYSSVQPCRSTGGKRHLGLRLVCLVLEHGEHGEHGEKLERGREMKLSRCRQLAPGPSSHHYAK